MYLKKAIQILKEANIWRRWAETKMPNPKALWVAIDKVVKDYTEVVKFKKDNYNQKKKIERLEDSFKLLNKENIDFMHLTEIWISQLQFSNLQNEQLLSVLNEIEVMSDDKLAIGIIKNWIEKYNLDRLTHTRVVFKR